MVFLKNINIDIKQEKGYVNDINLIESKLNYNIISFLMFMN